jgi:hypothetical protein
MDKDSDEFPSFEATLMIAGGAKPDLIAKKSWRSAFALINGVKREESLHPELDIRIALSELLNCFWYFQDQREYIAELMHKIGFYLCENYQCQFKFEGNSYYTDCPNMLLHQDYGFSLRGFEEYACSICGEDPIDCEHITGHHYDNIECQIINSSCNICREDIDACKHDIGKSYDNVEAIKIVTDLEIVTFDIVKEPEMAFTRINKIPYTKDTVLKSLHSDPEYADFIYGESPLYCLHCTDCKGYNPEKNSQLFSK